MLVSEEFGPGLLFESVPDMVRGRTVQNWSIRNTRCIHDSSSTLASHWNGRTEGRTVRPDDQTDSILVLPQIPCPNSLGGNACWVIATHSRIIRYDSYQFVRSNEIVHELFMNFIKWSSSDLDQVWSSLTTSIWKRWFSDWLTDWIHTRMAVPEIHTPEFNTEVDSRFWIRKPKPSLLV